MRRGEEGWVGAVFEECNTEFNIRNGPGESAGAL